jgi:predicted MFS family arabinose efflux permease
MKKKRHVKEVITYITSLSRNIHYGWVITLGCALLLMTSIGLAINIFSIFISPLAEKMGTSIASISIMISLQNTVAVFAMTISGILYSKFSVRHLATLFNLCLAVGYFVLAFSTSLSTCYAAAVLIGIGYGGSSLIPVSILLTRWFNKSRGTAMAAASIGSGITTILLPPPLVLIMETYSLRAAFITAGSLVSVLAIVFLCIIYNYPADKGLLAYGSDGEEMVESGNSLDKHEISVYQALKMKQFYFVLAACFFIGATVVPTLNTISPFLISLGYDSVFAAFMISLYGVVMIFGKALYGIIMDKYDRYISNFYIIGLWLTALLLALFIPVYPWFVYLFPIFIGLGMPVGSMGAPFWASDLFGIHDYTRIFTFMKVIFSLGGSAGILVPGLVFERFGSYNLAFILFIGATAIVLSILQILYRQTPNHCGYIPRSKILTRRSKNG